MPEDQRKCRKCGYQWYAKKGRLEGRPTRLDALDGLATSGAANVARKASRRQESLAKREHWATCPRCGSRSVKTVVFREFVATGLAETLLPSGTAVRVDKFPYTGKTGTITKATGKNYWVKLDDGRLAIVPHRKVAEL